MRIFLLRSSFRRCPRFCHSNCISSILHLRLRSNPKSIHSQCCCMDITEEQRKRAEANRLAAIAKRKALVESSNGQLQRQDPWKLFKCRKLSTELSAASAVQSSKRLSCNNTHLPERFRVRLEISSPDSFSITPEAVEGYSYPGEENCFRKLSDFLFNV